MLRQYYYKKVDAIASANAEGLDMGAFTTQAKVALSSSRSKVVHCVLCGVTFSVVQCDAIAKHFKSCRGVVRES